MELFKSSIARLRFDPVKCSRRLLIESNNKLNEWIEQYSKDPGVEESLVSVVRHVFDLPDYDNVTYTGYTDKQALELLSEFTEYIAKKP